ncbi:septum formation initiator family protein [Candidatus Margulisiibacteriota bacterium]
MALLAAYLTQQVFLMNLNHNIASLEKELETIHQDNERLRLEYAQSENLGYVERIAVHKLGMVRPRRITFLKSVELASK